MRPSEAPSISYMEGALLRYAPILPGLHLPAVPAGTVAGHARRVPVTREHHEDRITAARHSLR